MADIAAGMYAYSNILAALMQRQQTGQGQHLDISMLEALTEWMGFPLYYAFGGAPPPPRTGASHATIYPYGPFAAGDGKTVMLGLQNEREWKIFCDLVMLQPALATEARFATNTQRSAQRDALHALILQVFSGLTADQVVQRLEAAGIANGQVNTMAQVWAHPQLAARGRWREVDTPAAGRCPRCCQRAPGTRTDHAWMRCRPWGNTPMRSWAAWAMARSRSPRYGPRAWYDRLGCDRRARVAQRRGARAAGASLRYLRAGAGPEPGEW